MKEVKKMNDEEVLKYLRDRIELDKDKRETAHLNWCIDLVCKANKKENVNVT